MSDLCVYFVWMLVVPVGIHVHAKASNHVHSKCVPGVSRAVIVLHQSMNLLRGICGTTFFHVLSLVGLACMQHEVLPQAASFPCLVGVSLGASPTLH